jgi:hypothetical protein
MTTEGLWFKQGVDERSDIGECAKDVAAQDRPDEKLTQIKHPKLILRFRLLVLDGLADRT